jgi:hypothetical protein
MIATMPSKNESSARKGKATEHLVAAIAVLATGGELNALTALVDDEGVDVTFKRRNGSRTLDVQVKARFSDEEGSASLRNKGMFLADARLETFRPREDLYMLYVAVNGAAAEVEWVWLVPSEDFANGGFEVRPEGKRALLRFQASAKEGTQDKWSEYRMHRSEFPTRLLGILTELEPEVSEETEETDADDELEAARPA